jgi:surface polysaccharide O-acyltransferase-like enzyme
MIMVVCLHTFGWGGLVESALVPGTYNWYLGNMMHALSLQAVNCFVLISGYFLCTSKFKLSKLVMTWMQILFYSVGIAVLLQIFHEGTPFSVKELIKCALPFTLDRYWFVTDYLLLYMTFPFFNLAIRAMNQKTHFFFCVLSFVLFSLLPNVIYISDFSAVQGGYSYVWFCVLYLFASYIRLYVPQRVKHQNRMFPIYVITALVICGERFLAHYITPYIFGGVRLTSLFYSYNSIVSLFCALALFQTFRGMDIRGKALNKTIRFVAPLTFAVYLIHEHDLLRPVIWELFNPGKTAEQPYMALYVIGCVILIFVCCCAVEWLRQLVFKVTRIDRFVKTICDSVQSKIQDKFPTT